MSSSFRSLLMAALQVDGQDIEVSSEVEIDLSDVSLPSDPHPDGEPCMPRQDYLYKILVIGEFGVGKTSLIRRYTEGIFSRNYKLTIGVDFALKVMDWGLGTRVSLQLWDIAGHERFGHMTNVYYKHAVGAVIVFDMTRPGTFDAVTKWLNDLHSKATLTEDVPIPCILLANKCDVEDAQIDTQVLNEFCRENGILTWFPTSAKHNINIEESMEYLTHHIMALTISEDEDLRDPMSLHMSSGKDVRINIRDTGTDNNTGRRKCCSR